MPIYIISWLERFMAIRLYGYMATGPFAFWLYGFHEQKVEADWSGVDTQLSTVIIHMTKYFEFSNHDHLYGFYIDYNSDNSFR